ncbi:unnamed protein product [Rhizoctonia solani]|uniref:Uncharacterized protein n=1 Tax=Rhizoctonia solani TaxID=456999 RepID=A0A8H3AH79_9AGAM|nr:unnamed protein product [Rhizoctonia solani]
MSSQVKPQPQPSTIPTPVHDGTRFALAAPEIIQFPEEKLPVFRILDSFVFLSRGSLSPLPDGWIENTNWAGFEVVGAVTTLTGPTAPLVQCGWITQLQWRWVRIISIRSIQIKRDPRFRKGEPCFWLTTSLGEYAILSPHRGYSALWDKTISQPNVPAPVPTFRQVSDSNPMPAWWDASWGLAWPPVPKVAPTHKRTASAISGPGNESVDPDEPGLDGERHVRRRDEGKSTTADRATNTPEADSSGSTKPAPDVASRSGESDEPPILQLGVVMSRKWDMVKDRVEIGQPKPGHKNTQKGKNVSS